MPTRTRRGPGRLGALLGHPDGYPGRGPRPAGAPAEAWTGLPRATATEKGRGTRAATAGPVLGLGVWFLCPGLRCQGGQTPAASRGSWGGARALRARFRRPWRRFAQPGNGIVSRGLRLCRAVLHNRPPIQAKETKHGRGRQALQRLLLRDAGLPEASLARPTLLQLSASLPMSASLPTSRGGQPAPRGRLLAAVRAVGRRGLAVEDVGRAASDSPPVVDSENMHGRRSGTRIEQSSV